MNIQNTNDTTNYGLMDNNMDDEKLYDSKSDHQHSSLKKIEQYWEEKQLKSLLEDELFRP